MRGLVDHIQGRNIVHIELQETEVALKKNIIQTLAKQIA
jgi:hypothetical protein